MPSQYVVQDRSLAFLGKASGLCLLVGGEDPHIWEQGLLFHAVRPHSNSHLQLGNRHTTVGHDVHEAYVVGVGAAPQDQAELTLDVG